VPKSIPMVVIS